MNIEHPGNWLDLKEAILTTGKEQIPQLIQADPKEVDDVVEHSIKMVEEFTAKALAASHPEIKEDTDVVWEVPGPGVFSNTVAAPADRYMHLSWSRNMDRLRLRTACAIVRQVASLRAGKLVTELSQDDLLQYGPALIYTGTPEQNENLRIAISTLSEKYKFPPVEKIHLIDKILNRDGTFRDSYNTIDAVESLSFPEGIVPRRMVIVSNAEHLVRVLHILGKFHESIPDSTIVQPYPLATPNKGRSRYAEMEIRGTLAAIYGLGSATPQPYSYQV